MREILKNYLKCRPLFLSLIRAKEAWLFQRHLPLKPPVLDVGCGDGFFAKIALGKVDIGIDLPDSRIKGAGNTYKKLIIYDGHKIPLKSGSMATVVSNCVLEHVPNLKEVINEIHRILKPGGMFLTTVMAKPWEENLMFGGWYKDWMRKKQIHHNLLTDNEWRRVFGKFKIIEEVGYLSPTSCKLIDFCHYLSIPSLISYKLSGKWDWGWKWYPTNILVKIMSENVEVDKSGAIFLVLEKL